MRFIRSNPTGEKVRSVPTWMESTRGNQIAFWKQAECPPSVAQVSKHHADEPTILIEQV